MKTLIVVLILAAFLQTTVLPIDLVLLILISRAYIKSDNANLYLALAFGLVTAHLNFINLGLQSIIYLVIIQLTQLLSKTRLAGNLLLIVPTSFALLFFNQLLSLLVSHNSFDLPKIIVSSFLSLPILYLVKLWEERFIVQKEVKLKI